MIPKTTDHPHYQPGGPVKLCPTTRMPLALVDLDDRTALYRCDTCRGEIKVTTEAARADSPAT
jgi:hypothetical protein